MTDVLTRRLIIIGMSVLLLLGVAAALIIVDMRGRSDGAGGAVAIGGPFSLVNQDGQRVTEATLAGKPFAIFFGFAHCPEVCPTTLFELTEAAKEAGPAAADLPIVMVTVDPERDTPEALKSYLTSFEGHVTGLTGTPAEIAAAARAYRAFYQKVPTEGGDYTMDHSAFTYLMDANGKFVDFIGLQEPRETRVAKLRKLVGGEAPAT
ncbi:SCO family protein [Zavarzinia sp. CC-PAN008]|uniref:SCO family protein n=1 Tax=Zavarzinia sp. CC-PAN008 TaxID=3243332 RepID=UPI003F746290